jgi:hypothetical protein
MSVEGLGEGSDIRILSFKLIPAVADHQLKLGHYLLYHAHQWK